MIVNPPDHETLNDIALALYFKAWMEVSQLSYDLDDFLDVTNDAYGSEACDAEKSEYLRACRSELQASYATLQQANELALKARICSVSPYLLLLGTDLKAFSPSTDTDFSTLRTIDAVDLPRLVNAVCRTPLPPKFISQYEQMRSQRNKIAHLGDAGSTFDPDGILKMMVLQYINLWPARFWLNDYLHFSSKTRLGLLADNKNVSTHMEAMNEWVWCQGRFTKAEFKSLFGIEKRQRRYICHSCLDNASMRYSEFSPEQCTTAYLSEDRKSLTCLMCLETFPVTNSKCRHCKGDILNSHVGADMGRCHSCASHQNDKPDWEL
jgi:hypothetical protein